MTHRIERIKIEFKGKKVTARRLTVASEIPISLDLAWRNVQTPALLQFIAKGMIRFKPAKSVFPQRWEEGKTYSARMYIFGFIPFGGIHYLHIKKVDPDRSQISTNEWDSSAKVWNHDVFIQDIGNERIRYTDSITIYGGFLTGFITAFAKRFYKHRQKRWQIVAEKKLVF